MEGGGDEGESETGRQRQRKGQRVTTETEEKREERRQQIESNLVTIQVRKAMKYRVYCTG